MFRWFITLSLLGILLTTACQKASEPSPSATDTTRTNPLQSFQVYGVVLAVKPREKQVEIRHEAVSNYMPAMTMPFDVKDTNELAGLEPGSRVTFRLLAADTEAWIDHIRRLSPANTNGSTSASLPDETLADAALAARGLRVIRDTSPLQIGDPLPEYQFTNQLGEAFTTTQFKGQVLALTFLFTRCPFPTFCPRMAGAFAEAQTTLMTRANAPTNWHLLTISFDPDFDTPAVLKNYAQAWHYDPARWTFATGDTGQIIGLGDQLGLVFGRDDTGSLTHNLRTVVVSPSGRVEKVFSGNTWTSAELVDEILKAARASSAN